MAINIPAGGGDEEDLNATINTTPLVDVMLVMLIIFLITIPVVITVIPVNLPKDTDRPTQTKPVDISLSIDANGKIYWGIQPVADTQDLSNRMHKALEDAVTNGTATPRLHIRADKDTRFEYVGRVILVAQQTGIPQMAFIIEPPPKNAGGVD
jgi:biopolymer transport protein ExbD